MAQYRSEVSDDPQFSDPGALAAYCQCRRNGCTIPLAKMLALRQPPQDKSDRTFMQGLAPKPLHEEIRLRKAAERMGADVNGATYLHGLARFRGDPQAFVRSRDDIKRLAEQRPMRVEMDEEVYVDTLTDRVEPVMPDIGVDPGIIERETQDHERKTGVKLRGKERVDFKERLHEKRKPDWSKAKYQPTKAEES